jgi:hypothetical protein
MGMESKAKGNTMQTMQGRERWVGSPESEVIEGELSLREEVRPAVGGVKKRDKKTRLR